MVQAQSPLFTASVAQGAFIPADNCIIMRPTSVPIPLTRTVPFMSLVDQIRFALARLTRLPVRPPTGEGRLLSDAVTALPVVGLLGGFAGALVFALTFYFGLTAWLAGIAAVAAMAIYSNAWSERGLVALINGLAGRDRVETLERLADQRPATGSVLALVACFLLRAGALMALGAPLNVFDALLAAGAISFAMSGLAMFLLPEASSHVAQPATGRADPIDVTWALLVAALVSVFTLGFGTAIAAMLAAIAAALAILALAQSRLGGQTAEVVAAVQQVSEIAALLAAIAVVGTSE